MFTPAQAVCRAEQLIGENLTFLHDALDPQVRQKNRRVMQALDEIDEAWEVLAKARPAAIAVLQAAATHNPQPLDNA